jgi:hypothetical protein
VSSLPAPVVRSFADVQKNLERMIVRTVISGIGSPEGVVAAPVGALYTDSAGGAGSTLYVKETGGSTATGWAVK